jgi:hypothetical protein
MANEAVVTQATPAATETKPAAAAGAPAPAAPQAAVEPKKEAVPATGAPETKTVAAAWLEPAKPAATPATPESKNEEIKYELKAPEGASLDAAALEGYVSFAKEHGLTPAQAQKILERDVASQKAANDALMAQVRDADQKSLKEIQTAWGDKFGEYSEDTKRAFDYVDPDGTMRKDIERAGVAHYRPLVEAFRKFGGLLKNGSLAAPSIAGPTAKDNRTPQEQRTDYYRQKMEEQRKAAARK